MNVSKIVENHIVQGAGNRGKTSTIKGLVNYMIENEAEVLYPSNFNMPEGDFHCILRHTNKLGETKVYAILSAGDTKEGVDRQWDNLNNNYAGNIDIVIGASRTSGATVNCWEKKIDEVHWFDSNKKDENNHQQHTTKKIEKLKTLLNI